MCKNAPKQNYYTAFRVDLRRTISNFHIFITIFTLFCSIFLRIHDDRHYLHLTLSLNLYYRFPGVAGFKRKQNTKRGTRRLLGCAALFLAVVWICDAPRCSNHEGDRACFAVCIYTKMLVYRYLLSLSIL